MISKKLILSGLSVLIIGSGLIMAAGKPVFAEDQSTASGNPPKVDLSECKPDIKDTWLNDNASWLGISTDQLKTELKDNTFKQVAESHGKTEEDVTTQRQAEKDKIKQKIEDSKACAEQKLKDAGWTQDQINRKLHHLKHRFWHRLHRFWHHRHHELSQSN